jgi:hypothetical protein
MVWYMGVLDYFWNDLLLHWLETLFAAPYMNLDMLWILVPVWISWFFAEFFQEKIGTSMGNAITNATIVVWAAIDCARQTVKLISGGELIGGWDIFARLFLISLIFVYGIAVLVLGWKGNPIVKKIGRIREMTYIFAMFVPIFYNEYLLTFNHVFAAVLFFPLFYYVIELFDRLLPDPVAIKMDADSAVAAPAKPKAEEPPANPQPATAPPPIRPNPTRLSARLSPLLARRKGRGFWDFKL